MANNHFKVTIDGKDYTRHTPFPIKWQQTLDQTLDYSRIDMKAMTDKIFTPLTPVEILMTDRNGTEVTLNQLMSTDAAREVPVQSSNYNHEMYLIEQTKELEGIVVEALTFTNDLGRNYASEKFPIEPTTTFYRGEGATLPDMQPDEETINKIKAKKDPIKVGKEFTFPSWNSMWIRIPPYISDWMVWVISPSNKVLKYEGDYYDKPWYPIPSANLDPNDLTIMLEEEGTYKAIYEVNYMNSSTSDLPRPTYGTRVEFSFRVVKNEDPLPKWNITSVINRILDLAEPHLAQTQPRYHLNAQQAEEFAQIDAFDFIDTPEFMLPSGTLREDLDIIGGYIHGIARLNGNEISYDMLDGTEQAELYTKKHPYVESTYSQDIESYCSSLDSTVDNFVCMLDEAQGTIADPYYDGYKTVRTETIYARIEAGNMFISTQMPIQQLKSVKVGFVDGVTERVGDITPYIFESAEYARLSSYSGVYPTSKAYALYYTQGEKNIYGLNFKVPDATGGVFQNYAITNIINAVAGVNNSSYDYPLLSFQVEYIPIFRARVQQSKQYIGDISAPRSLCYNQGSNLVETRYYGENMKGNVARMGTVDRMMIFNLRDFSLLPKLGQMWGDDYYISQIVCELLPEYLKCQISLSKDFNRLSQYIGINSVKRFYEVSEKQAYARDMKYVDYVVIGDEVEQDTTLANIENVVETFTQSGDTHSVSHVIAQGVNDDGSDGGFATVLLPVVSAALGDAMFFTCSYEDNYSAGSQAVSESAGGVSGIFTNGVAYGGYYGRFPSLKFEFYAGQAAPTRDSERTIGKALPAWNWGFPSGAVISTPGDNPLRVDKNGAEIPSLTYMLEAVTNRKSYIIGSALARNCPLVRGTDTTRTASLYILPKRISKFAARVSLSEATKVTDYTNGSNITVSGKQAKFADFTANTDGAAWVIVTSSGELLFGSNEPVAAGETVSMPYITLRHDIYNLGGNNQ